MNKEEKKRNFFAIPRRNRINLYIYIIFLIAMLGPWGWNLSVGQIGYLFIMGSIGLVIVPIIGLFFEA